VAAAYTVNYYGDYGLTPADYLLEDSVASISVFRYISLNRLANAAGVPVRLVRKMNPSYVRGFVPSNKKGYRLRIPLEYEWEAQRYVWGRPNLVMLDEDPDIETAQQLANDLGFNAQQWLFGCKSENLRHQPSLVQAYAVAQMNLRLLEEYEAVAMN
jgi:membrane-bound lytic murein transglycosylase D